MKVILNVSENFKPLNGDMLVYDEKKKTWLTTNFQVISKEPVRRIMNLETELSDLNRQFNDLNKKYNRVLEIVKEHIKNG